MNEETSYNFPKLTIMNRNWSTLHLKLVTVTFHSFSISCTLCVTIDCLWSLLFSLFSNWAHTKLFFSDQSFKPLHFIDLDNVIHTLKVLSLLLRKCFLCVNLEFSVFLYILNLYLIWMMTKLREREGTSNLFFGVFYVLLFYTWISPLVVIVK